MAWTVEMAKDAETTFALGLLDTVRERGFAVANAIMDAGYDNGPIHDGCMDRGICPVTPLRQTTGVARGDHKPRVCEHGEWTFARTDYKRQATKWRCPTGECQPKSMWVKADRMHALIPRHTERSRKLYASRGAIEREFGRLKHEWAMLPLRVRGIERVRLHADLTILAKLACALSRARGALRCLKAAAAGAGQRPAKRRRRSKRQYPRRRWGCPDAQLRPGRSTPP